MVKYVPAETMGVTAEASVGIAKRSDQATKTPRRQHNKDRNTQSSKQQRLATFMSMYRQTQGMEHVLLRVIILPSQKQK